jgi:hypothetical protein
MAWVHTRFCKLQKRVHSSDKDYQLLAHGRWFSLGTLASSTTKNGHHDIAEILLKVALNTINQSINKLVDGIYTLPSNWSKGSLLWP